ncbi:MAG: hypothetical protein ACXVNO_10165 [Bacteroidia bacterium]
MIAKEKVKLYDIIFRLDDLKKRNVIPHKGYIAFRTLLKGTAEIISETYEPNNLKVEDNEFELNTHEVTNDNIMSLINSKNTEVKKMILEYFHVLGSLGKDVKYPWLFYFLPIIFSEYLRKKLFHLISSNENFKKNVFSVFDINQSFNQFVPSAI